MAGTSGTECHNPLCDCDPCECDPCLCGATTTTHPYKGKTLTITQTPVTAVVEVDGSEYTCTWHEGGVHGASHSGGHRAHGHDMEPVGLPMWMCDEAYFGAFDLIDLARHFADYDYMFNDPNRIVCDIDGNVIDRTAKKRSATKTTTKKAAAKSTTKKTAKKTTKKSSR